VTPSFCVMCFFFQRCIVNLTLFIFLHQCVQQHCSWSSGIFFPWSLLSITFCNKESCLKTCPTPIQLFCRFLKVSSKFPASSSAILNTCICSFDPCHVQGIFIIHRQIHVSRLQVNYPCPVPDHFSNAHCTIIIHLIGPSSQSSKHLCIFGLYGAM